VEIIDYQQCNTLQQAICKVSPPAEPILLFVPIVKCYGISLSGPLYRIIQARLTEAYPVSLLSTEQLRTTGDHRELSDRITAFRPYDLLRLAYDHAKRRSGILESSYLTTTTMLYGILEVRRVEEAQEEIKRLEGDIIRRKLSMRWR